MTTKGGLQRRQQRQTLFAQRGQIAANASKGFSESLASEAAGDFLLDLDHPKISLGEIIVKIHTKILKASSGRLSAVCASDRADCERHFVCIDPCAGYLGHLFTKLESCASTIALISSLAFMKRRTGPETREQASQCSMNILHIHIFHQPSREGTSSPRLWKKTGQETQKHPLTLTRPFCSAE